jgi:hypothetical protein
VKTDLLNLKGLASLKKSLTAKELSRNWRSAAQRKAMVLVISEDLKRSISKPAFFSSIGEFQNPTKAFF